MVRQSCMLVNRVHSKHDMISAWLFCASPDIGSIFIFRTRNFLVCDPFTTKGLSVDQQNFTILSVFYMVRAFSTGRTASDMSSSFFTPSRTLPVYTYKWSVFTIPGFSFSVQLRESQTLYWYSLQTGVKRSPMICYRYIWLIKSTRLW